jgi:hypothetical protein
MAWPERPDLWGENLPATQLAQGRRVRDHAGIVDIGAAGLPLIC